MRQYLDNGRGYKREIFRTQRQSLATQLSTPNSINITLSITTFQTINLTRSNRSRILLLVLLLSIINPHISLPFSNISTGLKSTNASKYKLLSLTYILFSPINHLLIENHRSFIHYASPRLSNQLSDSLRQPRQSCRDSPLHSLVSSSLSSSLPLSSSITPLLFHSTLKRTFRT